MKTRILRTIVLLSAFGIAAAQAPAPASPTVEKVTPRVSMIIAGFNGAITVFQSAQGPVIVDCADPGSASAVQSLIRTIDSRTPAAMILTHYHGDHTGGLATLAAGAPIYAHETCLASYRKSSKSAEEALGKAARLVPSSGDSKIQIGDETIHLIHPAHAHTSGDTIVVFEKEKVISAGDLFFNGVPPYIDVADGSDTGLWADTIDRLHKQYPGYKVIAGHGSLSDTAGWTRFAGYLRALRKGVADAIKAGQTRDQAQASVNLDEFSWIQDRGAFLTKKANIGWVYDEMSRKK